MKAIVQHTYGAPEDVLELREIDTPVVEAGEVLLRVRASSVHTDVWHVVMGFPFVLRLMGAGLRRPRQPVPGTDAAGTVEAVGPGVTRFQPGDEVFGETHMGMQWVNGGSFAEFVSVPQDALAHKPANISFREAAAVPTPGFIAVHNLGDHVHAGGRVLINGAGGAVGSIALQIAKSYGAHVTAVDHGEKLDMLRSLGADRVVDYTNEDITRGDERYDLIFDVASNLSLRACKSVLARDGGYVFIGHDHFDTARGRILGSVPRGIGSVILSPFSRHLIANVTTPAKRMVMKTLAKLMKSNQLTPIIDRTYPLEEVPKALEYLQTERTRGRVVITL